MKIKGIYKKQKTLASIARVYTRGYTILTNAERALKTRAFNDSQDLGEQFGEQTEIKEQILFLFDKLEANEQAVLLEALQGRIQNAAK